MIYPGQTLSSVPINDRGFNFGDGSFTTIAVTNRRCEFLAQHIKRLKHACNVLNIAYNDWQNLTNSLESKSENIQSGVIKVVISRGTGGRGYSPVGANKPVAVVSVHNLPDQYANWQKQGITVGLSDVRLAYQPKLAGIKHLNRLEQVLVKQELETMPFDDLLVTDNQGYLIESSAGNLFWRKGNVWFTPDLSYCGVEGVLKSVLKEGLRLTDKPCFNINAKQQVLHEADEVFVCNCLMKIVPIKTFTSSDGKQTQYNFDQVRDLEKWLLSQSNDKN